MQGFRATSFTKFRALVIAGIAAVVAVALSLGATAAPGRAEAADLAAANANATTQLATQAASYEKAAVTNAKAIIKKAGATKGADTAKLKSIFTYIAKDASFKGVYSFANNLPTYYSKYGSKYYSMVPARVISDSLFKKYYKKYAVDMQSIKQGTCFHYAALFAVTAKQALGSSATVKLAAGPSKHTGSKVNEHSWVEVTMGKKTYIYDPQGGNNYSKYTSKKATDFGKFCGTEKSKMKSVYYSYKNVQYTTVKL